MERQDAHALRANASHCAATSDWSNADDRKLVDGMLANNESAWLEFLGRHDELLTQQIGAALAKCSRALRTADLITDIKGDVEGYLSDDGMRALRGFDPRHGSLSAWVTRIAVQSTLRRVHTLTNPHCVED